MATFWLNDAIRVFWSEVATNCQMAFYCSVVEL